MLRLLPAASPPAADIVAIVAMARKLAGIVWGLLTRGEDYAYGRPR